MALPRFTSRPSDSRMMKSEGSSLRKMRWTWGFTSSQRQFSRI